jgi:hypothetical protein
MLHKKLQQPTNSTRQCQFMTFTQQKPQYEMKYTEPFTNKLYFN